MSETKDGADGPCVVITGADWIAQRETDDPDTADTSGTDGMIPADVLDLVDDATLCAIRIASAKGEFGEGGKAAIREAFAIRHDDLDAELDVDGDRVSRLTLMMFHVTAEHARALDGEARAAAEQRVRDAAPDLLSVVKWLVALPNGVLDPVRYTAEKVDLMRQARAAIAKAEGR